MILTYKIKHEQNFERELILARKIAEYGLATKSITSKDVYHIGLKSMISNQILKKYSKNKKLKNVNSVQLTIPNQGIKIKEDRVYIPCLKLYLDIYFNRNFKKINQIEIGKEFAFISVSYEEPLTCKPKCLIGVDRNTTNHTLVASNIDTGKVLKLGKECSHVHKKYKAIRKQLQKNGKLKKVKQIKNRESRIIKNINHQISRKLVNEIIKVNGGLVLENIKDIRKTVKTRKKQRYSLNSWSFYQLQQMIEYKAKKLGIPIFYVEPQYTSQRCSRCGHIEEANRRGSLFQCKECGTVEDSGANAGFNIAYLHKYSIPQFCKESDLQKGNTDIPKEAMLVKPSNFRTQSL
ncbi:MAG: transposase [Nanoarchaeota archaeon]